MPAGLPDLAACRLGPFPTLQCLHAVPVLRFDCCMPCRCIAGSPTLTALQVRPENQWERRLLAEVVSPEDAGQGFTEV